MITLEKNGLRKKVSTGYSWKSLLFGVFYPISRGDMKGVIIQTVLVFLTMGACWIFTPFVYNKIYIKRLLHDGWQPDDIASEIYLHKKFKYRKNEK